MCFSRGLEHLNSMAEVIQIYRVTATNLQMWSFVLSLALTSADIDECDIQQMDT
jgi:hypothetical protein